MKQLTIAAAAAALLAATSAQAGPTLDKIKQNGTLRCGVNVGLAGFSAPDSQGNWTGHDVDYCRALAAALLGDAGKVTFVPLSAQQRFTALQSGEVDILSRNTTWTLSRDAGQGLTFVGTWFYDGQGFIVPKSLGVSSAKELGGASVCVQSGTTTELNLADYFRANGLEFTPVVFEGFDESVAAFFSGRCDAYTTDASGLASIRSVNASNPDDFVILPELISKEPLGPAIARGDQELFTIARWVLFALLEAEEKGITSQNVQDMKASSTDPTVQRLLGAQGEMGQQLGLDSDWAVRAIQQVGNYAEIFDRNVGAGSPLRLERGLNALWTEGGLHYAPPVR